MRHYNKKSLYSYLIIAALILAIGVTVFFGEHNQAKLKSENLKLAEEITESINKEEPKLDEDDNLDELDYKFMMITQTVTLLDEVKDYL